MKKIILMLVILFGILSFSENNSDFKVPGEGEKFTTDGNLHEDKILNKWLGANEASHKITKDGKDYLFVLSIGVEGKEEEEEYKEKAVAYKNMCIRVPKPSKGVPIDSNLCIGYDTKYKKPAAIDLETGKIMFFLSE